MEELTCRLLPYEVHDGPHNMAADEVLLTAAASGVAALRFYGWTTATVSLGYFQSHHELDSTPALRDLPLVRRATGGMTLVHQHELNYCLALPAARARFAAGGWLDMHTLLMAALAAQNVTVYPHAATTPHAGPLCFATFTSGDLMLNGYKVVGSAQRKQRGAIMQHGGILLAQSAYTPTLPGIRELTGVQVDTVALRTVLAQHLRAQPEPWTPAEQEQINRLAAEKYSNPTWTHKR